MSEILSFRYTGGVATKSLEALRLRYAAFRDVDANRVVFAPNAQAFAIVGADPCEAEVIGTPELPLAVIITSGVDRQIETALSDGLVEAGFKGLSQRALGETSLLMHDQLEAVASRLGSWPSVNEVKISGATIELGLSDSEGFTSRALALGLDIPIDGHIARLEIRSKTQLTQLMARLAIPAGRVAEVERVTKETAIRVHIDLDRAGNIQVDTGIGYFDHMLEQIAKHGGFSLNVVCKGDLEIDTHHTIEDVSLALGEALNKALGDRRGIGRFGFELPMDETRAGVWIDLSGRPFSRFDGTIPGEMVGEFPVEMTSHVFRSLSETLKAAIHVSVEGENAHHMIESCFKAFGRALRQGLKIEGTDIPSTKGVL